MNTSLLIKDTFRRVIALPQDHGSWVFLLSPLLIGLAAGGNWNFATFLLVFALLSAFLARQPMTILTKVLTGRRPRQDLAPSIFWVVVYGLVGLLCMGELATLGYGYLLLLAIPGAAVFAWHLILVRRRAERRQIGVELAACGVLALAAPAALWVGTGVPYARGWLLWALTWLQSAASIVYTTMRLEQRKQKTGLQLSERLLDRGSYTARALAYSVFNFLAVIGLALFRLAPGMLFLPYGVQLAETLWGMTHPATGSRPTSIGFRQLAVSTLFTFLFILTWKLTP